MVLIEGPSHKRREWKSGVIEKVNVSSDGAVRSVELRTVNGTLNRPVKRLFAYELNEEWPFNDEPPSSGDSESDNDGDADT